MGNRPQAVLRNNPFQAPQFIYPSNLGAEGEEPYAIFDIKDSIAKGGNSKGTIALPLPENLETSYNAQYEDTSTGIWGNKYSINDLNPGKWGMDAIGNIAGYFGNPSSIASDLSAGWDDAKDAIMAAIASASAVAQRDWGKVVNPHMAYLFKGVGFRKFPLNFRFLATNAGESDAINNILYTFKYHMHPSIPKTAGAYSRWLLYPENFVIGFFSPEDKYLFKTSICALDSMTINYNGSGSPAFFKFTGAPVDIRLTLNFTEMEIVTKERLAEGKA